MIQGRMKMGRLLAIIWFSAFSCVPCSWGERSFQIAGFSPAGDVGSIFPNIRISFDGADSPVIARMFLDQKPIQPTFTHDDYIVYHPAPSIQNILNIGTHSVDIELSDSSGGRASASWKFSVGLFPASTIPLPKDSWETASLTFEASRVFPNASAASLFSVAFFKTRAGDQYQEYTFQERFMKGLMVKSESLHFLQRFIFPEKWPVPLVIYPKSPCAFPGNEIHFSLANIGSGTLESARWDFSDRSGTFREEGFTRTKVLGDSPLSVQCVATISTLSPNGRKVERVFSVSKTISPIIPDSGFFNNREGIFSQTGTGSILIKGYRDVWGKTFQEGDVIEIIDQGALKIHRARWKIVGGGASPRIESPTASATRLMFDSPGYAEIIDDVAMSFDLGNEHYSSLDLPAKRSGLFGVFSATGTISITQTPTHIVDSSPLKIRMRNVEVLINNQRYDFIDNENFARPLILARSKMFPESEPLFAACRPFLKVRDSQKTFKAGTGLDFSLNFSEFEPQGESYPITPYFSFSPINFQGQPFEVPASSEFQVKDFRLKIISPNPHFPYPLGVSTSIETSLDTDVESWKRIRWKVNGIPLQSNGANPPFVLQLDHEGEWKIQAEFIPPTGKTVEAPVISDGFSLKVSSFSVSISPNGKVLPFGPDCRIPLTLSPRWGVCPPKAMDGVSLGGLSSPATERKMGKYRPAFPWDSGDFLATVEKIEWKLAGNPPQCGDLDLGKDGFHSELRFYAPGAISTFATVTLKIFPTLIGKYSRDPAAFFSIPASRADFWAMSPPGLRTITGRLPEKAIQGTTRTFSAVEIGFSIGEQEFSWKPDGGIKPPIVLKSAFDNVERLACKNLSLKWSTMGLQTGDKSLFIPEFQQTGPVTVKLSSRLDFSPNEFILLPEKLFPVEVFPLEALIQSRVEPSSATIFIGETLPLRYFCEAKNATGSMLSSGDTVDALKTKPKNVQKLELLDGAYIMTLEDVTWEFTGGRGATGNSVDFSASKVGEFQMGVQSNSFSRTATNQHQAPARFQVNVLGLISYPGEDYVFPASLPFSLKALKENIGDRKVEWMIDDTPIGTGDEVTVSGLSPGEHTIKASLSDRPHALETRKIQAFQVNLHLNPRNFIFKWNPVETKPQSVGVVLNANIDEHSILTNNKPVRVGKALLKLHSTDIKVETKSDSCFFSMNGGESGSCLFHKPGSIELSSKSIIEIVQPDGKRESVSLNGWKSNVEAVP